MYESPINRIFGEIHNEIVRKDEEHLMSVITQNVGYQVDKSELIKAMNYDRHQYKKGYKDGYKDGKDNIRWIPVSVEVPKKHEAVIGVNNFGDIYKAELYEDCGEKKWYANGDYDVPIVAWIPLPKSYKESEVQNDR